MQTIRIRVNDKIYKRLLKVLSRYNYEDIQIIEENDNFISTQQYLIKELEKLKKGDSGFIDINQLEDDLESVIRKIRITDLAF